jgi:trans-2,3-dihydro-3-hydroxyanthranilate isomerase
MVLSYRIVNVFTVDGAPLTGNPLAVFEDGADLSTPIMQALALQFNLSETTFIVPTSQATAGVRIFTPRYEMPFAGHPTLGTAHVVRALLGAGDALTLDMPAGVIPVQAVGNRWTFTANAPTWREPAESRAMIADALGLAESDIGDRPLWVSTGREQLIVPLKSEAAVRNVRPDAHKVSAMVSAEGNSMAYVFAPTGPDTLLARFFFPVGPALLEDPATGSATANLGGWLIATGGARDVELSIAQGEYTGRPSRLQLNVGRDGSVRVSGEVVDFATGVVRLPD